MWWNTVWTAVAVLTGASAGLVAAVLFGSWERPARWVGVLVAALVSFGVGWWVAEAMWISPS